MVGDIVGSPGRRAFAQVITRLRQAGKVEFVVANAENAAAGKGITGPVAEELLAAGADVITLGDHTWDQKDFKSYLENSERVVRPANFVPGCPGRGCVTVTGPGEARVSVINLVGRVFMNPYDCPFRRADELLRKESALGRIVLVDMHAEATSEKVVMGRYLDGRVSCVVGTHTHVQTSDETILPRGTAYITDLGMTGPKDSAIGRELSSVVSMFLTGMPSKFEVAENGVCLEGVIVDVDPATGRASAIRRLREPVP
jgi:hypothetical protein